MIEGNVIQKKGDVFTYPVASSFVGIFEVDKVKKKREIFPCSDIENKCIILKIYDKKCAINLLHE